MTAEPTAPLRPLPESPCSCGSGKPYAECCGAVSSEQAAASASPEFPRLLLALVTFGLLGALAWYLNPPQPDLTPAGLDPQVEIPTSPSGAPEEILPTSFTDLPDVDLSPLTISQKREVLLRLNTESCPCACGNTLASCRVTDSTCETSRELVPRVVAEVKATPSPE